MENDKNEEPAWINPENDRKTPYTDDEIESFVNDFIKEFPEHYEALAKQDGPIIARMILRERFRAKDRNRK